MAQYWTEWTGRYPNLCHGEWHLYRDKEELNVEIPFQGSPANTFGTYYEWGFDENYCEDFEDYEDGLACDAWCNEYQDYLEKVAPKSDWPCVFAAFQKKDWRHGICGGCIQSYLWVTSSRHKMCRLCEVLDTQTHYGIM